MELNDFLMNFACHIFFLIVILISFPPYLIYKFISSIIISFSNEDIKGKVVLITGASSGIGEQLAYAYAKRRARLVLVARRENLLQQVAEKARQLGSPDVIITCADVSNVDHCKRFVEEAIKHFGKLDHLVNNAGIVSTFYFEECTNVSNLTPVMDVNFWGSVYATHFAIPYLKGTKGKIIVTTSVAGWMPAPTLSIYGASKAALISFYETLRIELGSRIRVTIVCPSFTDSEMTRGKHLSKDGALEVDQAKIANLIGRFQVRTAAEAAKTIVNGVCRGEKCINHPSYMRMAYIWRVFFPDMIEWYGRFLFRQSLAHLRSQHSWNSSVVLLKI